MVSSKCRKIKWRDYFQSHIVSRGREYYRYGQADSIKGPIIDGDYVGYEAEIEGECIYSTSVFKDENGELYLDCDCAYGSNCKHEVALVLKIDEIDPDFFVTTNFDSYFPEDSLPEEKKDETELFDFADSVMAESTGDGFFDIKKILTGYRICRDDISLARRIYEKNTLNPACISEEVNRHERNPFEKNILRAEYVNASDERPPAGNRMLGRFDSSVVINRSAVVSLECNCRDKKCMAFGSNGDSGYNVFFRKISPANVAEDRSFKGAILCRHIAALFFGIRDYITRNNPGGFEDEFTSKIINAAIKRDRREIRRLSSFDSEPVDLVPTVEYMDNSLKIGLCIGHGIMYVIRDVSKFVDDIVNGAEVVYGKHLQVNYDNVVLTRRAEKIVLFLKAHLKQAPGYWDDNGVESASDQWWGVDRKKFIVDSSNISFFYRIFHEEGLECENGRMKFSADEHFLRYDLVQSSGSDGSLEALGVVMEKPMVIGDRVEGCRYFVTDNCIVRCSHDDPLMDDLFASGKKEDNVSLVFSKRDLPHFVRYIQPFLEKYGVSDTPLPDLSLYDSKQVDFAFFLDFDGKEITCTADVAYGKIHGKLTKSGGILYNRTVNPPDLSSECSAVVEQLDAILPEHGKSQWSTGMDSDAQYSFIKSGVAILQELGTVNLSDSFVKIKPTVIPPVRANVSVDGGLMDLQFESDGLSAQELVGILASYRKKKKYHRLKNGGFIELDGKNLSDITDVTDSLDIEKYATKDGILHVPAYRAIFIDSLFKAKSIKADRDSNFCSIVKGVGGFRESDSEVPDELAHVLRPYQVDGFRWLKTLYSYNFGGILADEMGLGKTVQMIALVRSLKDEKTNGTALVVSPASLVYNWLAEIDKFSPSLKAVAVSGKPEDRKAVIDGMDDYDILVTSYDYLKRDILCYRNKSFFLQVLDEAQYIKNHSTEAFKTANMVSSTVRFALTGTPIENRLSELWSIFSYLMPDFLFSYEKFRKNYEIPITKNSDSPAFARLRQMTSPFILRRQKTDVLKDLPEKIEENIYTDLENEQKALYNAQVAKIKGILENENDEHYNKSKITILAELMRLRQICCDPSLVYENYTSGSAKLDTCLQLIENAISGGHRLLVFSQFTSMLSIIEKALDSHKIKYLKIIGETPKKNRLENVDRFNSDTSIPVFLISLKAGGTGLNLTGADMVIHYDPWWNVAAQNQATDRAHRIGQTRVVMVYRVIARNTIEEKIMELQEKKEALSEEMLSGEGLALASLTRSELLGILGVGI